MARAEGARPEDDKPEEELFTIELQGVERDVFAPGMEAYDVTFVCARPEQMVEATVTIDVKSVTTLDVIPKAMGLLYGVFAALAEQTRAWARKP